MENAGRARRMFAKALLFPPTLLPFAAFTWLFSDAGLGERVHAGAGDYEWAYLPLGAAGSGLLLVRDAAAARRLARPSLAGSTARRPLSSSSTRHASSLPATPAGRVPLGAWVRGDTRVVSGAASGVGERGRETE